MSVTKLYVGLERERLIAKDTGPWLLERMDRMIARSEAVTAESMANTEELKLLRGELAAEFTEREQSMLVLIEGEAAPAAAAPQADESEAVATPEAA